MVDYAVYGGLANSVKASLAGDIPEFARPAGVILWLPVRQVGMRLSIGAEV